MTFAGLLSPIQDPLLRPAAHVHVLVRQRKPVGRIACTHHQQPMADGIPVSHPVATAKDQSAWEEVLQQLDGQQQPANMAAPATAHPAVGASQAESAEWEAALFASTHEAPLQGAPCSAEQGVYAVVECGSHSTRLLLSTGAADIARINRDTHLAAVLNAAASPAGGQHPQLPAGSESTLAAVREYKQRIDVHKGDFRAMRAIATAAVRDAPEGPAIAAAVHAILQCPVEVVSGEFLLADGCSVLLQHITGVQGSCWYVLYWRTHLLHPKCCQHVSFTQISAVAGSLLEPHINTACRPSATISQWGCGCDCRWHSICLQQACLMCRHGSCCCFLCMQVKKKRSWHSKVQQRASRPTAAEVLASSLTWVGAQQSLL